MSEMALERGLLVHLESHPELGLVKIDMVYPEASGVTVLYVIDGGGQLHRAEVDDSSSVRVLPADGRAPSARVLAAMWTLWMDAAATNAETSAMASTPLKPYAHQTTAVYGAMLPQPLLRFLLADEPGTGKTIMAGLYLREMQRLGLVRRALIVCPANLASKWVDDFGRLLGGGLRQLTVAAHEVGDTGRGLR